MINFFPDKSKPFLVINEKGVLGLNENLYMILKFT